MVVADSHKRVLVVDDDRGIREMLASVLRHRGLTVDEASDGAAALDLLRDNQYAVILLDLLMPVADGFAVLKGLEADDVNAPPVVLVITGAERRALEELDSQRVHGVVRKPFDTEELASLVATCADIRGRSGFAPMAVAMLGSAPLLAWFTSK
jgi:CheY-like chemotaxis protein